MSVRLQRRRDSLAECSFRHDHVSQQYDVYYSWYYSRMNDDLPGTPSGGSPGRRHRRRRWYLGVDRHGNVRTFRMRSVQRPHDDDDAEPEFQLPQRVLFYQRWVDRTPTPSPDFPAGRVAVVPPGWSTPPPPPADAPVAPDDPDERRKRKQRRRRKCSRLLTRCRRRQRLRRQRRRQKLRRRTSITTTDVVAVLRDS